MSLSKQVCPTSHESRESGISLTKRRQLALSARHMIAAAVLAALVMLAGIKLSPTFALASRRSRSSARQETKPLSAPASASEAASERFPGTVTPAAGTAAAANVQLSKNLNWTFGSKTQRGWAIYTPLICGEIGTDADVGTAEFAQAVARWQGRAGFNTTGVLDEQTWSAMIRDFQSQRIKYAGYPPAGQLVTVPAALFYDPQRPEELRQVQRDAYEAYKRMLAAAAADPQLSIRLDVTGEPAPSDPYMKIISAFRPRQYQEQLRKQSPNAGRAGLAVNSPHFSGRALDLYVGGDPVSTKDDNRLIQTSTPIYHWLVKNAGKFGFKPYFYEPWHWEYCPDTDLHAADAAHD